MSPIRINREKEIPAGEVFPEGREVVLFETPLVRLKRTTMDDHHAALELPASGVEVISQHVIGGGVVASESITLPMIPIYVSDNDKVVVSHPETEQKVTLTWEPRWEWVESDIKSRVDSEIKQRAERERFPLHSRLWDWGDRGTSIFRGLALIGGVFSAIFLESWSINAARTLWDRRTKRWEREKGKLMRHAIRDYYAAKK